MTHQVRFYQSVEEKGSRASDVNAGRPPAKPQATKQAEPVQSVECGRMAARLPIDPLLLIGG